MQRVLLLASLLMSACLDPHTVQCASGRYCPQDTVCDEANQLCVDPSQITACDGKADGDVCVAVELPGSCVSGTCVTLVCGNGIVQPGEQCDDGNRADGDGCRGDCVSDETCGNGIADYTLGEECDCGRDATTLAQGCKTTNSDGGFCRTDCKLSCGDGQVGPGEVCDGAPPNAQTCLDYGFDRGALDCSVLCTPLFTGCGLIGWKRVAHGPVNGNGVWAGSPDDIYMVGPAGLITHYDGTSTASVASNTTLNLTSVWGSSATDVYAVGFDSTATAGGVIHFDGTAWSAATVPAGGPLTKVIGTGPTDVWVLGPARVLHFDGTSWATTTLPSGVDSVTDLWPIAAGDAWLVSNTVTPSVIGKLAHWNGTAWSVVQSNANQILQAVWASSDTAVYAGGQSTTQGNGWDLLYYNGTATTNLFHVVGGRLVDLWGSGSEVHALDEGGKHTRWDGTLLTTSVAMPSASGLGLASAGGSLFALGSATSLTDLYEYGGLEWSLPQQGQNGGGLSWLQGTSPNDVYWLSDGADFLLHWNGKAWSSTLDVSTWGGPSGFWLAAPNDIFFLGTTKIGHYTGSFSDFTVTQTPNAIWGASASNVFAVGNGGTIYRYTGAWAAQTSPVTTALRGVWGTSATDVFAVGDGGAIVHFNGTTWSPMTSPTTTALYSVWGLGPTDVYAVGDLGTLLHYDGTTWTALESGTDLPLYGIGGTSPTDLWFVGEQALVLHRDTSLQWTPVRSPDTTGSTAWTSVLTFPSSTATLFSGRYESAWLRP